MRIDQHFKGWYEYEDTPGSTATATHAAESGKTHHVLGVYAYPDKTNCTMQLKDGSTTILTQPCQGSPPQQYLPNPFPFGLHGIPMTPGNAVSAVVGTGTSACEVFMWGYTTD